MKTTLVLTLLLLQSALALSSPASLEINQLYRRGLAGDAAAVNECIARLEAVLQKEPANQLARVYLGSAYTLRSRDLGFGPQKLSALRHGLALMDEAVAAAPADGKILLARALTTEALPGFFGRGAQSRRDFAWLAEHAAKLDPDDRRTVAEHVRAK